jgi:nicotinate-nucleotide adenylyltransferase
MRRIGLLGGSFNPAHEGHLHITLEAFKRLGLSEVWWLVSPHNPLKSRSDLADYSKRFASAAHWAHHPRIRVLDIEERKGFRYSIDTIAYLQKRHHDAQFVWLMGADNLAHFHRWKSWQTLLHRLPMVILDRAPYAFAALRSRAALRYRHKRLTNSRLVLRKKNLPMWVYLTIPRHPQSATNLRKTLGAKAFLEHNRIT